MLPGILWSMAKKPTPSVSSRPLHDCRVVIIQGKEAFLRTQRTTEVREALHAHFGGVDVFTFDGNTAVAADVLDECRSFGLIAQHKLVIVDEAEELVKDDVRPLFERYAEAPCEGATLVLRGGNWRAGKLDKLVDAVGVVITCTPPTDNDAQKWAVERARVEHRARLDPEAASMLVMRVGAELGKIDTELGKLAAAAGDAAVITPKLVSDFVGPSREEKAWNIQYSLLTGSPEQAMQHLRYVLDVSREPPQLLMYAFVDLARKVHGASRALRQGAKFNDVTRALKLWGPSVEPVMNAAKNASPERALRLLRDCVQADVRSKSGLGDTERTLERLVVRFANLVGQGVGQGQAVGR
jgi:DNA polymerase III subunit delta